MILAVCRQLILARTLKAVEVPVERFVVWIPKHRANSGTLDALGATFVFGLDKRLVGFAFLSGTLDSGATDLARSTLAGSTRTYAPGFTVLK